MTSPVKTPQFERIGNALATLRKRITEVESESDGWKATRTEVLSALWQAEARLERYLSEDERSKAKGDLK